MRVAICLTWPKGPSKRPVRSPSCQRGTTRDAETVVREFCAAGDRRNVEVILTGRIQALDTRGTVSPTEAAPRTPSS